MRGFFGIIILIMIISFGCSKEERVKPGPENQMKAVPQQKADTEGKEQINESKLFQWAFLGRGEINIDEGNKALFMTETEGSKGVTLVSPESYGENCVVTLKAKPMSYESVIVIMLNVSNKDTGGEIEIPADYDGNFGFWTDGNVQNYLFAFHNSAHQRKPFILKNPGTEVLAENDKNVTKEQWFDVEVGKSGSRIWLKIDGETIIEATDQEGKALPGGKVCLRLRGTGDVVASALFKDVCIREN